MLRSICGRSRLVKQANVLPKLLRLNSSLSSHSLSSSPLTPLQELQSISREISQELKHDRASDNEKLLLGDSYSSSFDGVYRESNSGEILRLWTLLELCLESEQYDRALSLLDTLEPLATKDRLPFVNDLNRYLEKWSLRASLEELSEFVLTWKPKYGIPPNGKTYAILVNSALKEKKDPTKIIKRFERDGGDIASILLNIEILGIKNLKDLIDVYHYDANLVPSEYRELIIENNLEPEETLTDDKDSFPETLEKENVDNLQHVDTFGMKAIRHTLLALKPEMNKTLIDDLDEKLKERMNFFTQESGHKQVNFFKVYRSLPLELRDEFDASLDNFNQERQRLLENRALLAAQEKWKHDFDELKSNGSLSLSKSLNATLWQWSEDLLPLIEKEIELCKKINDVDVTKLSPAAKKQRAERAKYAEHFSLLSANKMSAITILELLKMNATGPEGMRTARAVVSVSNALELEFRSEQLLKSQASMFRDVKNPSNLKKYAKALSRFTSDKFEDNRFVSWDQEVKVKIGSLLISMLMHVAKVPVEGIDPVSKSKVMGIAPAFYHSYQYQNSIKVGVLKVHRTITSQLSSDALTGSVNPQLLPMLVKPRPWSAYNKGGYLYSQGVLIRSKDAPEQMAYLKASSDKLDKVYEGLNVLGSTAWTVNERVFNVMSKIWNTGKEFLDIPPVQDELVIPEPPEKNADPSVIFKWKTDVKKLHNEFNANRSMRCDSNYKLEIARAFIGEKMYFPHNLDFRGRAYPLSPNLNHLGNDLSRGLLIFWKGKPLGENGLDWLKIHLSNLFGIDKAPLHERVQFATDNIDKVFKTADDPLGYQEWWVSADKPWQALATIFELADALRSPDPTKFLTHQPVHQDGTCNGLQHYAALGGDIEGARQVNLVPAERPQDVYTFVANLVKKRVDKEAAEGHEIAIAVKDKIKRKVVKQTVMTNVYGVTYVGATAQIDKQLADLFPGEDTYQYSVYLTKHVFKSIRELFHGAHLIQDWLAVCAKLISNSVRIDMDSKQLIKQGERIPNMASVIWTTPLDLPIVQPYRAVKRKQINTNLQTVYISDPFAINPVDSRKQMAAFPPNFIHSLDATHMLMSAIGCSKHNIDFASVHDSYWTHAGDVPLMNKALREQFIKLHEVDLIARLKEEFDQRYKGFLSVVKIPKNTAAAKKIVQVRKQLTKDLGRRSTLADEIFLERKRQSLLNSDVEELVNEGKAMVTTVSVLEDEDMDKLIQVKKTPKKAKEAEVEEREVHLKENEDGEELEEGREMDEIEEDESSKPKKSTSDMRILSPLRLPDIPPKGDFDVEELRNSQYFFS